MNSLTIWFTDGSSQRESDYDVKMYDAGYEVFEGTPLFLPSDMP